MFQYSRPRKNPSPFAAIVERARTDATNQFNWTKPDLERHVRGAIELEFFTIPPYLTALYSIQGRSEDALAARRLIRSVVVEEMLHMELACNVSTALGIALDLPAAAPTYPASIPFHIPDPRVGLTGATPDQLAAFMTVELPTGDDPNIAARQDVRPKLFYDTIGEFYGALVYGLVVLEMQAIAAGTGLFLSPTGIQQSAFANHFEWVHDLDTAIDAFGVIVAEGEGAAPLDSEVPVDDAMQSDTEVSHYSRFKFVLDNGHLGQDEVAPIDSDQPPLHGRLLALDDLFNAAYSLVINDLQTAFSTTSTCLGTGIDNMLGLVQTTAMYMMTLELGTGGFRARPTFAYDTNVAGRSDLSSYVDALDPADRRMLLQSDLAGVLVG